MNNTETECYKKTLESIYRLYRDWDSYHDSAYADAIGALAIQALNRYAPKEEMAEPEGRE